MRALYFAYGSNLKIERFQERVASAAIVGRARLEGFRLVCDKSGADGSGKANLRADRQGVVWGAVYALDAAHWPALDACERRYMRLQVRVETDAGSLEVQTYRSEALTDEPVPFRWYRRLILEGAREHALPPGYLRELEALPSRE